MRIGHGFDVHRFCEGDSIVLGGETIAFDRGMLAHSDGDVLIHALCDALLGAAALGDIGQHFPDNDAQYRDIDSRILLRKVYAQIIEQGFVLGNADITIIAQKPKMASHIEAMRCNLADDLESPVAAVNVKATTTEGLGYEGRSEGISVHAVVLLQAR